MGCCFSIPELGEESVTGAGHPCGLVGSMGSRWFIRVPLAGELQCVSEKLPLWVGGAGVGQCLTPSLCLS